MKPRIPFSLRVATALAIGAIISIIGVYAITRPDLAELGVPLFALGLFWDAGVIALMRTILRDKKRK